MIAAKHIQFLVVCLGVIIALYVGSNIVALPTAGLIIILATVSIIIWMLFAGVNWWVPFLAFASVQGVFFVGVKIYPFELGFALCVVGLLPLVMAHDNSAFQYQRKQLPAIFYITALYFIIRLLIDVIPGEGARGSLSRILFGFTWSFFFSFLFHNYGSLTSLRAAFIFMFVLLFIRIAAALVGFFANVPLIVPGINYVLSFSAEDSLSAMRTVAATVLFASLVLFHSSRSFFSRLMLAPVFLLAEVLVLFGAGRFQTFASLLLPLVFFAWSRKWFPLFVAVIIGVGVVSVINVVPGILDQLPRSAGRSLSGLVFVDNMNQTDFVTTGSDSWHDSMREEGFKRWTKSPITLLFGDGISPSFDFYTGMSVNADQQKTVENAANIGAYESGLWTLLAPTGLVGLCLYAFLFITLLRDTVPHLMTRPRGTFWEGIAFWSCFSSVTWFLYCYFQGATPGFELFILVIAWNLVHEGKLDDAGFGPTAPMQAPQRAPGLLDNLPLPARG